MAMSQKDRRALVMGGVVLGLIALYFFVIEPLAVGYADMNREHDAVASRVARLVYNQKKNAYLTSQIAEYEENNGLLEAPKPYDVQITAVGEQIVTAAMSNGLQLKGTTPGAPVAWPDDPALEMSVVRIDAEAEWEKVFGFIGALYRVPGVLSVEQMELTSDPKKGGRITVRLGVSILAAKAAE